MTTDAWAPPDVAVVEAEAMDDGRPGPGLLIDVWLSPRQAVRTVLDHGGRYGVLPLAGLVGVAAIDVDGPLEEAWVRWAMVGIALTSPLWGLLGVWIEAFFVWLGATVLGERVAARDLVVAVAWGRFPHSLMALPGVAVSLAWGFGILPEAVATPMLFGTAGIAALGWCWSWATVSHAVGEVLQASAWRGLLVYVLPWLALTGFIIVVGLAMVAAN